MRSPQESSDGPSRPGRYTKRCTSIRRHIFGKRVVGQGRTCNPEHLFGVQPAPRPMAAAPRARPRTRQRCGSAVRSRSLVLLCLATGALGAPSLPPPSAPPFAPTSTVSTKGALHIALADTAVGRVVVAPGEYLLNDLGNDGVPSIAARIGTMSSRHTLITRRTPSRRAL